MTPEEQAALDAEEAKKAEESEDDDQDIMGMSDEEFLKMEMPADDDADPPAKDPDEKEEDDPDNEEEDPPAKDPDPEKEEEKEEEEEDDPPAVDPNASDDPPAKEEEDPPAEDPPPKKEKEEKKEKPGEIDYKAEYEKLTAPFKANGVDIQVKNADDAVQLMQMGANYHKKMSAIKPSLKMLKLLENNGLLDEGKLNFLIDIDKKNPEAIKKLLKDSQIDPLDIKVDEESTYAPTNRRVSDTEVELDEVLGSIQDSQHYARTLNVVSKEWDETSRKVIANRPQIISVINAQMEDGSFDKVQAAVTYQRTLGRLTGVSDFDAYKDIGKAMYEAGELGPKVDEVTPPVKNLKPKKSDPQAEAKRKQRKKAASSTKKVVDQTGEKTYDPLSMSDEDFKKFDETKAKKLGLK